MASQCISFRYASLFHGMSVNTLVPLLLKCKCASVGDSFPSESVFRFHCFATVKSGYDFKVIISNHLFFFLEFSINSLSYRT